MAVGPSADPMIPSLAFVSSVSVICVGPSAEPVTAGSVWRPHDVVDIMVKAAARSVRVMYGLFMAMDFWLVCSNIARYL